MLQDRHVDNQLCKYISNHFQINLHQRIEVGSSRMMYGRNCKMIVVGLCGAGTGPPHVK